MTQLQQARTEFCRWERLAVGFPQNAQCQRGRRQAYADWLAAVRKWRNGL
jgi:hypothetical protein